MRWLALLLLVAACGDDSSDDSAPTTFTPPATTTGPVDTDGPGTDPSAGSAADSTTAPGMTGTTTMTTTPTDGTGPATTGPVDCAAPTSCAECWGCAVAMDGPCFAGYDACLANINCAGTMVCIESNCTGEDLGQGCLDTCCMSCTNLGTCGEVDPTVQCVAQQCAGLCDAPTCP